MHNLICITCTILSYTSYPFYIIFSFERLFFNFFFFFSQIYRHDLFLWVSIFTPYYYTVMYLILMYKQIYTKMQNIHNKNTKIWRSLYIIIISILAIYSRKAKYLLQINIFISLSFNYKWTILNTKRQHEDISYV